METCLMHDMRKILLNVFFIFLHFIQKLRSESIMYVHGIA